jgi:hypothetical protein
MNRSKRKSSSHVIGEKAIKFVENILPEEWTVRKFVPDYGIDLDVELFDKLTSDDNIPNVYDTLGEHLFVQVKGTKKLKTKKLIVKPRYNVELKPVTKKANFQSDNDEIEVTVFNIETPELVTVQRMGAAIPVLLFLVDITAERLFFVCLNDYIDKILLPNDHYYAEKKYKTIYIPLKNEVISDESSFGALRFYAKRAKYYAAFQKFSYQRGRLEYVSDDSLIETAQYFARILLRYDFWSQDQLWLPMKQAHLQLTNLVNTGRTGSIGSAIEIDGQQDKKNTDEGWYTPMSGNRLYTREEAHVFMEIRTLWDQLENLGAMYEEICREWSIPTSLGIATSY